MSIYQQKIINLIQTEIIHLEKNSFLEHVTIFLQYLQEQELSDKDLYFATRKIVYDLNNCALKQYNKLSKNLSLLFIDFESPEVSNTDISNKTKDILKSIGETALKLICTGQKISFNDITELYNISSLEELRTKKGISKLPSSLFKSLLSVTSNNDIKRKNYLTVINAIAWTLCQQAAIQGKIIKRGSFKILDNKYLQEFLLDYVKFVTGTDNPGFLLGSSEFGYARTSSHYYSDRAKFGQYGIDMRYGSGDNSLPSLPFGHLTHILFGETEYGLFFKLEEAGMGNSYEIAEHTLNWRNSGNVDITTTFREKDIPPVLKDLYINYIPNGKSKTVHEILRELESFDCSAAEQFKQACIELNILNPEIQTGQEVILDFRGLKSEERIPNILNEFYINIFHKLGSEQFFALINSSNYKIFYMLDYTDPRWDGYDFLYIKLQELIVKYPTINFEEFISNGKLDINKIVNSIVIYYNTTEQNKDLYTKEFLDKIINFCCNENLSNFSHILLQNHSCKNIIQVFNNHEESILNLLKETDKNDKNTIDYLLDNTNIDNFFEIYTYLKENNCFSETYFTEEQIIKLIQTKGIVQTINVIQSFPADVLSYLDFHRINNLFEKEGINLKYNPIWNEYCDNYPNKSKLQELCLQNCNGDEFMIEIQKIYTNSNSNTVVNILNSEDINGKTLFHYIVDNENYTDIFASLKNWTTGFFKFGLTRGTNWNLNQYFNDNSNLLLYLFEKRGRNAAEQFLCYCSYDFKTKVDLDNIELFLHEMERPDEHINSDATKSSRNTM